MEATAAAAFEALTGHAPMRWQRRLLDLLLKGELPAAVSLPTGLGKTSVMTLWLIARALCAPLPRRLIYVVDRRVVVDQASREARNLRCALRPRRSDPLVRTLRAGLGLSTGEQMAISTLRGALRDNGEWRFDPTLPAIIVGTVDMIGSRLLFEGYGVSRRMRPLHAALLGCDTLMLLDEAHLVPPFEALLSAIATDTSLRGRDAQGLIPTFHLLPLSATGRSAPGAPVFRLCPDEAEDEIPRRRLGARKWLRIEPARVTAKDLSARLAIAARALAGTAEAPKRVLVYCDRREHAMTVAEALGKPAAQARGELAIGLLVGERRGHERELAARFIREQGFRAGAPPANVPACLVATSAGEVGLDIDADHLVGDVVAFERMVQRLGRVNRRGQNAAEIELLWMAPEQAKGRKPKGSAAEDDASTQTKPKQDDRALRAAATVELLGRLPKHPDGRHDASPRALAALLDDRSLEDLRVAATTPEPLRPALTRALVDAWSLTNLDKHTGRPEIAPWLRGWVEDVPEVTLVWRRFLPWRAGERAPDKKEVEEFFEHAAPVRAEMLEAPLWRAAEVLKRRAEALRSMDGSTLAALVLDPALALDGWMTLADLSRLDAKRDARLAGHIVVVASFVGGLSDEGLLDEKSAGSDSTAPGATQGIGCTADGPDGMRGVAMRIALGDAEFTPEPPVPDWVLAHSWAAQRDDEGTPTRLLRVWEAQRRADPALARRAQSLACHTAWVVKRAEEIAQRLNLPAAYRDMLVVAARLHDLGKATERWQRAFGAPADGVVYGKTAARRINHAGLDGYRHEFGSVILAPDDPALGALAPELRDLALHLIAAHHGRARPILEPRSADVPPGRGAALATETALRFARLQRQWGPWGLAWWESLLRLADAAASAELERPG